MTEIWPIWTHLWQSPQPKFIVRRHWNRIFCMFNFCHLLQSPSSSWGFKCFLYVSLIMYAFWMRETHYTGYIRRLLCFILLNSICYGTTTDEPQCHDILHKILACNYGCQTMDGDLLVRSSIIWLMVILWVKVVGMVVLWMKRDIRGSDPISKMILPVSAGSYPSEKIQLGG